MASKPEPEDPKGDKWAGKGFGKRNEESRDDQDDEDGWVWE
jgi:hypothetical protein